MELTLKYSKYIVSLIHYYLNVEDDVLSSVVYIQMDFGDQWVRGMDQFVFYFLFSTAHVAPTSVLTWLSIKGGRGPV